MDTQPSSFLGLLGQALALSALGTLVVAAIVLRLHHVGLRRDQAVDRAAQELALVFARYLNGACDAATLRRIVDGVSDRVFWAALEAFNDNIAGEEWERLSRELHGLAAVGRESARLGRRSGAGRALAARHLGLLDVPGAHSGLRAAMERGPGIVTLTAALSLARLKDRRALAWLLRHPERTAHYGRYQLVALIKRFGFESHPELRRALRSGPVDHPIHLAAVEVLGLRRDFRSRRLLEGLLASPWVEARIVAARALGRIGSSRSMPALQRALQDVSWEVRAQASRALGENGSRAAAPLLGAGMGDRSWWVRRHSAYALAKLGDLGRTTLQSIAASSSDRYARDMAEEALQALEWEAESPGGVTRVG